MKGVDDDICKRVTKKEEQMAKQLQNFFLSDLILGHSHRLQRRHFKFFFFSKVRFPRLFCTFQNLLTIRSRLLREIIRIRSRNFCRNYSE